MNYNEFFKELEKQGIVLSSYQQNQFKKYEELLVSENEKINLTSITKSESGLFSPSYTIAVQSS